MLRLTLAALFCFAVIGIANFSEVRAEDKKADSKTLEGKLVCTKCKLGETDACGNALIVKTTAGETTYYIKDTGKGETYHKCSGEVAAKVTGKVTEKDGKKMIEDAKVEKVK